MRQLHTFIVRILPDEGALTLHGQITQPSSTDDWHASFSSAPELWQKLTERLQITGDTGSVEPPEKGNRPS